MPEINEIYGATHDPFWGKGLSYGQAARAREMQAEGHSIEECIRRAREFNLDGAAKAEFWWGRAASPKKA